MVETVPISALQHWLYCQRQCCLIHVEQIWMENLYTAEGRIVHERVDVSSDENRKDLRIIRAFPLVSESLGLVGKADVVELYNGVPYPIEYKRGKTNSRLADAVQLCAQAICLEEMFECKVQFGAIYYRKSNRRVEVNFSEKLRLKIQQTTDEVRNAILTGLLPPPVYEKRRCNNCSLFEVCKPKVYSKNRSVEKWLLRQLE